MINGAIRASRALTPLYAPLKSPAKALSETIMPVREIIKLPDKRLRLKSEPVKQVDAGIKKLVDDMFETMYDAPGIGLAAIQLGVAKRVIIMDLSKKDNEHKPQVFINAEITWKSDEKATFEEGCLSIPEYYEEVERPAEVKVKYLDLDGKSHEITGQGPAGEPACSTRSTTSTACLFIDHLSKLKRDRVIKKFAKAAKNTGVKNSKNVEA